MRRYAFFAAAFLAASRIAGHPICFVDTRPPDLEQTLTFCPAPQDGACCTDAEEAEVIARFNAAGPLSDDCADLYKQVQCGQCHSYSGHLFADLGGELGVEDGMTMKSDFCEELVDECAGEIDFPTYDGGGTTYCEKHTGDQENDFFWSYPYEEPEVFEPNINEAFPDLDPDDDFPAQTITMHQVDADNMDSISTVLDISGPEFFLEYEEGLLDFAFGPLFGVSGYPDYFYVSYTVLLDDGEGQRNRISRFEYFAGSPADTLDSEDVLITTGPKSTTIHAAGWCGFKPSDYGKTQSFHDLYWTTGDAGPQTDPDNNSQNTLNLQGAMIRVSVPSGSDSTGYAVPSGNYGSLPDVLPEICAIGFRNPWRCSFDRENDDLWCGDVGHTNVEEINIVECGNNYGWSRFEGSRCQEAQEGRDGPCAGADRSGFTFPVFEYCHPDYYDDVDEEQDFTAGVDICGDRSLTGHAVIGGHVYRGQYFADVIAGAYVFADNQNMNVYYIKLEGGEWKVGTIISDKSVKVIGITEDINGELILISNTYKIYRMPCSDLCFQRGPSMTAGFYLGCFDDAADSGRLLDFVADTDDMTAELCAGLCGDSPYYGTQYERECWCGDADTDFSQHGDGVCDRSCTGDTWEVCGGYYAISAYAREDGNGGGVDPVVVDTRNPTPAPLFVVGGLSYLGCFADEPGDGRVLSDQVVSDDMSVEVCAGLCAGQAYFGVQFGEECWCGDPSTDISQHGTASCGLPCSGDSLAICGGEWAFSAYAFTEDAPPPSPFSPPTPSPVSPAPPSAIPSPVASPTPVVVGTSYVGCFADPKADVRLMPTLAAVDASGMTAEVCSGICAGSTYFGTQYGEECWCTDEVSPDFTASGSGVCNYPCTGAGGGFCGGYYAISIYEYVDEAAPTPTPPTPAPLPPTPSSGQTCSNGLPGIENVANGVCCPLGCDGKCGGFGCGRFGAASGLGTESCCVSGVIANQSECSVSGAAPCVI